MSAEYLGPGARSPNTAARIADVPARSAAKDRFGSGRQAVGLLRRRGLRTLAGARTSVDQRGVALTFDDGPDAHHTPPLLDVLRHLDVRVTFFMRGDAAAANPDIVRRAHDDGHTIGSHTMHHPDFRRTRFAAVRDDIAMGRSTLEDITGSRVELTRPPRGHLTARSAWHLRQQGYSTWLWDLDAYDWKDTMPTERVVENIVAARAGNVVLLHDTRPDIAAITGAAIVALRASGERLVTLA